MPSTVEHFAEKAAQLSQEAFVKDLGAIGVFVRLDERGGEDEPAPWAFHHAQHIPQTAGGGPRDDAKMTTDALRQAIDEARGQPATPPEGPDPNLFADDEKSGATPDAETVTRTFHGNVRLPVPPARGAASVIVVKAKEAPIVGREDSADVVIGERSVSKAHAQIHTEEDGTFALVDKGSRNGTKVNGRRVKTGKRVPLRPGDLVTFGDVLCLFISPELLHQHVPTFMD